MFSGHVDKTGRLVEIIELPDHPFFVAGQFHPELKSRPTRPHPLFRDFVGAAQAFAARAQRSVAPSGSSRRASARGRLQPDSATSAFRGSFLSVDVERGPAWPLGDRAPSAAPPPCCRSCPRATRPARATVPAGDPRAADRGPGRHPRRRGRGRAHVRGARAVRGDRLPPHADRVPGRLLHARRGSPTSTSTCSSRAPRRARRLRPRTGSSCVRQPLRADGGGGARRPGPRRQDRARAAAGVAERRPPAVAAPSPASRPGQGAGQRLPVGPRPRRGGARVIVGIPKEVKDNEYRVAATPEGVRELVAAGHRVVVESVRRRGLGAAGRAVRRRRRRDRAGCRRGLRAGRHDREGQGAAAAGVRALPGRAAPVHVPAPGGRRAPHALPRRARGRRPSPTRPCRRPTAGCRCWRR